MRIALDERVISDAEAIKTICGVNSDFTRVACSASDQNLQAAILQSDIYLPLQLPECQGDVAVGHHLQRARYPPKAEMIMTFMTSKWRHGERSLAAVIEPAIYLHGNLPYTEEPRYLRDFCSMRPTLLHQGAGSAHLTSYTRKLVKCHTFKRASQRRHGYTPCWDTTDVSEGTATWMCNLGGAGFLAGPRLASRHQ